ncbi:protein kinase domain-containing protein [Penicillium psychrosexuale]|uniref:protein kinase domain-containing protein n=1 Tax=Penicillium psychrosexuale TaxID=1002107 RepID=UPI002544F5BF|nr:protein kinase domain-containing protein [Penicillium psychrosexuale]KAJ5784029.1 protein kinase domain-containing protein [Penicillium psychrosexuale]
MPAATAPVSPFTIPDLELKSYCEDRDFRAEGRPEPNSRSQALIYHFEDKKWWIKVTFKGAVSSFPHDVEPEQVKSKRERRKEFQQFVTLIDFHSLALLDDTVTELILSEDPKTTEPVNIHREPEDTNRFAKLINNLRFHIREDPLRVAYPPCIQFPSFRAINVAELIEEDEITDGVFRVLHRGDRIPYILKVVNRPLYQPRDTDVIRKELENLEHFRGVTGIVQPAGIAVFANPYATSQKWVQQMVVSGILLEYYSGGSLQRVLNEQRVREFGWERWAVQIGNALGIIHRAKKTHMDLKPSNVVLDDNGNAVLIDISGIGGVTHGWRAPEIRDEISPFDLPFQTRRLNGIWAFGKLLMEIASNAGDSPFVGTLKWVADHLTEENVHSRWTLSEGISQLKGDPTPEFDLVDLV